MDLFNQFKC